MKSEEAAATIATGSVLFKIENRINAHQHHRVMPVLALLLLCSFLDRTNVGNAKILGLEADLGITDKQYSQGLAVFYATYIAWSVISLFNHQRRQC